MDNEKTQFNGLLARHLEFGDYFNIDVKTAANGKSFHIKLSKEKLNINLQAEIGLYVDLDFVGHKVTSNGLSRGVWKDDLDSDMFTINLQICDKTFYIAVNGKHRQQINYNEDMNLLKAIQIGGDISQITRMDHRKIYPTPWPPKIHHGGLSFCNDIPIQFEPGHLIVIAGQCYGQPNGGFFVQMLHAFSDTELFIFYAKFDEKVVIRNTFCPPNYGVEERAGIFPFDFYKPFRLSIACKNTKFVIAVNGHYFCSFKYRDTTGHPLSSYGGVRIFGINDMFVKITELDHMEMINSDCSGFENYSVQDLI